MLRDSFKRLAIIALTATSAGMLSVGCDNASDKTDRQVHADITEAQHKSGASSEESQRLLEKAAGEASATSATKAYAKSMLAQAEMDQANALVHETDRSFNDMARLIYEMSEITSQINAGNKMVAGYRKHEPKDVRESLTQKIAEARGGEGKTAWVTTGNSTIPTLGVVTQEISRLTGEITKKEDELTKLQADRQKAIDESEKLIQQADTSKGKQSVDTFKKASELRKQAGEISVRADAAEAALIPLKADLAVAQAQKKIIEDAVAGMEDRRKQVDASWEEISKQIGEQINLAKLSVEGTGSASTQPSELGGPSIAEKSAALAQLWADSQKTFEQAEQHLNSAAGKFGEAASAADEVQTEYKKLKNAAKDPKEVAAWDGLHQVYDPAVYRTQQAIGQQTLATLYAGRAATAWARQTLAQGMSRVLADAELKLPKDLETVLQSDAKKESEAADPLFKTASESFQNVIDRPEASVDRRNAARIGKMFTMYEQAQMLKATGASDKEYSPPLDEAKALRDSASQEGATFPPLPPELAPPVTLVATSETAATAPTSAPATEPGVEAAPAAPAASEPPASAPAATETPATAPAATETPAAPAAAETPAAPAAAPAETPAAAPAPAAPAPAAPAAN